MKPARTSRKPRRIEPNRTQRQHTAPLPSPPASPPKQITFTEITASYLRVGEVDLDRRLNLGLASLHEAEARASGGRADAERGRGPLGRRHGGGGDVGEGDVLEQVRRRHWARDPGIARGGR